MRNLLLVTTLAMAVAGYSQPGPAATFDPAGKWSYTSLSEDGAQVSGTMTITGKPGAYTGAITTGEGQEIPITDVFTSPTGMVVLATLPDGGSAVVKVTKKADGTFEAGWAAVRNVIPAKVQRAK